jgi:hypothetical protein
VLCLKRGAPRRLRLSPLAEELPGPESAEGPQTLDRLHRETDLTVLTLCHHDRDWSSLSFPKVFGGWSGRLQSLPQCQSSSVHEHAHGVNGHA